MRVLCASINVQVLHLSALQRAARNHTLDSLLNNVTWVLTRQTLRDGALFNATRMTRVVVEQLLAHLVACQGNLFRVDDDDIVATINMRGELWLMLAAQTIGDNSGETAKNEPFGVDQDPVLRHLRRLQRLCSLHR